MRSNFVRHMPVCVHHLSSLLHVSFWHCHWVNWRMMTCIDHVHDRTHPNVSNHSPLNRSIDAVRNTIPSSHFECYCITRYIYLLVSSDSLQRRRWTSQILVSLHPFHENLRPNDHCSQLDSYFITVVDMIGYDSY